MPATHAAAIRRATIANPHSCSSPPRRPTLSTRANVRSRPLNAPPDVATAQPPTAEGTFQASPVSSLRTRRTAFSGVRTDRMRRETRSAFAAGNSWWPHGGPMDHRDRTILLKAKTRPLIKCSEFLDSGDGRSRTRTWDLFLIREAPGRNKRSQATARGHKKPANQSEHVWPPASARNRPRSSWWTRNGRAASGPAGYPGGHAPGGVRPEPGRMGHLWRHPGGGRERSPGVARGVVPAVPCGARPPLRRA